MLRLVFSWVIALTLITAAAAMAAPYSTLSNLAPRTTRRGGQSSMLATRFCQS